MFEIVNFDSGDGVFVSRGTMLYFPIFIIWIPSSLSECFMRKCLCIQVLWSYIRGRDWQSYEMAHSHYQLKEEATSWLHELDEMVSFPTNAT